MRTLLLFFLAIWLLILCSCDPKVAPKQAGFKADIDTSFNNGSNIASITLDSQRVHWLTNLGMLWGFLKYHHPAVSRGNYNMDAELFRVLPQILAAKSTVEVNKIIEAWTDHFGIPDTCKTCTEPKRTDSTVSVPDYGYLFDSGNLAPSLIAKLVFIKNNTADDTQHYYIGNAFIPAFKNETEYADKKSPDAGLRLLALFRYWNMIQYFSPNRYLIGEDWNKVLTDLIPVFCTAVSDSAYNVACMQMISRVHDTHATLNENGKYIEVLLKGDYTVPFKAEFIEDKFVVTDFYSDSQEVANRLRVGDVIEKIDGVAVDSLVKRYLSVTSGSNYPTQLRELAKPSGYLLAGKTASLSLQIERFGHHFDVTVNRSKGTIRNTSTRRIVSKIMDGNIGYIYPGTLEEKDFDSIKVRYKNTKGIVIDMRCYPGVFMPYTYGNWFKPKVSAFAHFTYVDIDYPGWCTRITLGQDQNGSDTGDHYKGKLVVIVNSETQSQAEYTTMAFSSAPGALVIGSTTAGADGGVSGISLPGGRYTGISGVGVLYADGTQTQRVGVKIDRVVKPTISGIKERRDELLEYAIKWINSK